MLRWHPVVSPNPPEKAGFTEAADAKAPAEIGFVFESRQLTNRNNFGFDPYFSTRIPLWLRSGNSGMRRLPEDGAKLRALFAIARS